MKEKAQAPFITRRKIQHTGTAYTISIPKWWFEENNIDPEKIKDILLVGRNGHILMLNPSEKDLYKIASDYIGGKMSDTEMERALLERIRQKEGKKQGVI